MPTGNVKFFNSTKGFGFIETNASDDDIFFHVDDLGGRHPQEGQALEFDIEQGPRGPRAKNVSFQ